MNRYQNEDIAWLHLQDMQREAENRRLTADRRPSAMLAAIRRLFGRTPAVATTAQPQSTEVRQNPA